MFPSAEVLHTAVGDIDIAYNTLGKATDPPVLLIAGLGGQLIAWDDAFCQELVDRGLFVIRFDNRDVGLSSHLAGGSLPDPSATAGGAQAAPYTLAKMAADAAGLIDNLGLDSAHVVGLSLGGMIAQILAIECPERVRSLTSIMSTTGNDRVGQPTDAARALLLSPPVSTRAGAMDRSVLFNRAVGSPAYRIDETELRDRAARAFDRAFDPQGVVRQLVAAVTTPDRTEDLHRLDLPTLVIHGAEDQLIAVSGGKATAEAIPGAELVVIDGMGHDLPRPLWPLVVERIAGLVDRAEQRWTRSASTSLSHTPIFRR
jgi:pimeloyl-ACP methyl ester carboxylesterase